jgi:hypothetical protein
VSLVAGIDYSAGAWAKPLQARKFHYFPDDKTFALCRMYMTRDVKPSQFGTGQPAEERCPTCERKLGRLGA